MEPKSSHPAAQWLDAATNRIRFKPDRAAVRAELDAHLEDKIQDLRRIFPNLSAWEATQQALAGMGDPEEIGRELAKLHKPWLGYLWRLSQVVLALALICLGGLAALGLWGRLTDTPAPASGLEYDRAVSFSGPDALSAGFYTLQAEGELRYDAGRDTGMLYVTWHAFSPLFWEEPAAGVDWWGEDSLGNFYPSDTQNRFGVRGSNSFQWVCPLSWERSGLGWTGENWVEAVPVDAQWVRLTLDLEEQPITILLEREEAGP